MNKSIATILISLIFLGLVIGISFTLFSATDSNTTNNSSQTIIPQVTTKYSFVYKIAKNKTFGSYFTDTKGMTLYLYTKDTPNTSMCVQDCAAIWPPFTAVNKNATLAGKFGIITRPNGKLQYTWKQLPLYYFSGDKNPGETKGLATNSNWRLAK